MSKSAALPIVLIDRWGFPTKHLHEVPRRLRPHTPVRGKGSDAERRLLEGLRTLCRESTGKVHTHREIADACKCSEFNIRLIERRAFKHARAKLAALNITTTKTE